MTDGEVMKLWGAVGVVPVTAQVRTLGGYSGHLYVWGAGTMKPDSACVAPYGEPASQPARHTHIRVLMSCECLPLPRVPACPPARVPARAWVPWGGSCDRLSG